MRAISKVSEEVKAQLVDLAEKMSVADANRLRKQADAMKDAMTQGDVNLAELRAMMRALQAKSKEVAMKSSRHPHWEEWQEWHNASASKKRCWKGRHGASHDMSRLLGMALRKWLRERGFVLVREHQERYDPTLVHIFSPSSRGSGNSA